MNHNAIGALAVCIASALAVAAWTYESPIITVAAFAVLLGTPLMIVLAQHLLTKADGPKNPSPTEGLRPRGVDAMIAILATDPFVQDQRINRKARLRIEVTRTKGTGAITHNVPKDNLDPRSLTAIAAVTRSAEKTGLAPPCWGTSDSRSATGTS